MNRKNGNMAVLVEFLTGSGLAIFFHLVLHYPEAAYVIFGAGSLLSLSTYLLREDITRTREELTNQYQHSHELTFAIASIADPECRKKAHEIMTGMKRTLAMLQQGYIPLDEMEFYMKGAQYTDKCCRTVKAVDPVTIGWDNRGALFNFYQANVRAIKRGVKITRIFVMDREELEKKIVQKVLLMQIQDGINVRIAFRDELPAVSDLNGRATNSSFDFAIFDEKVALEAFGQTGKYFGRKTIDPCLVGNYQSLMDLIEHSSHPVTIKKNHDVPSVAPQTIKPALSS